jgi:threonine dehydratase
MRTVRVPTIDDVLAARDVVDRHLRTSPVVRSPSLGSDVVLKLETLQPTGSFKVRGGLTAVAHAHDERIVTASAGNHGLGVAYAATQYGADATVVLPTTASEAKRAALRTYAVELVEVGVSYDEAEAHALHLGALGAHFVSPYNDPDTIAGQGTIALELFDQVPTVEQIVVPIGGGGLASGIGLAASLRPSVRVIGVQAQASPAMVAALDRRGTITVQPTLADGLAGNLEPGTVTIELARRYVAGIVTVSEDEIADAIDFMFREHGLVVEGSGAVGVAALRNNRVAADRPTAVVVTGRNIARDVFVRVLTREGGEPRRR